MSNRVEALINQDEDKLSDYVPGSEELSRVVSPAAEDESESDEEYVSDDGKPLTKRQTDALLRKEANRERREIRKEIEGQHLSRKASQQQKKSSDSIKRFSYLLGQTELFRHFCDLKAQRDPEFAQMLRSSEKVLSKKGAKGRARKTEKEEDDELLAEKEDTDDAPFVFTESPAYVNGKMRDYQVQGLNWMCGLYYNGINGILADEMGLGKTLQTISFLGYLKHITHTAGPHLIIVPKSTQDNWTREFANWVPDFNVCSLKGDKTERARILQETVLPQRFEVLVTSYEICLREKGALRKLAWEYIVIDEAHRIKNVDSMLSQIVRLFDSRGRLLITGTPLQNNLHELWALLNFLLPDVFSSVEDFDSWFQRQESNSSEADASNAVVKQLHAVLRPFLLRRVKADVEKSLLPKKEINVYVGMTDMQRRWYKSILEKDIDAVNGAGGRKEGKTRLQNIVMQLRKCCNHPYLFDGAEPGPPFTTDEHLVQNSGKMIILDKLLKSLKAKGSRVLIFSQMSRLLDILEDYCLFREFGYCRLDGGTAHEDRMEAIDAYNRPGSDKFIFLLTTRAGGLGINLTTADVVILYDSDWNPQADLQAMDRAHRIGQQKQVYVFRFVTENAVEEKVLERAAQKLRLDQLVIQQGRTQVAKAAGTSKDELVDMIQHGAEQIINSKESMLVDDDIDDIIRRGEARTQELNSKYSQLSLDDLQTFKSEATTNWEGEDYAAVQKGKKLASLLWIEPSKRERKQNYSIDGYYRETMRAGHGRPPGHRQPRAPKQVTANDFQFFPPRLIELEEREQLYFRKQNGYVVPLSDDPERDPEDAAAEQAAEQAIIDAAEPLTEAEIAEKETLYEQGFVDWTRRDYLGFIRGCEYFGKDNFEMIQREVPSKTVEEVAAYAAVFWERYREIDDYEKQIKKIEDADLRREKDRRQTALIQKKVASVSYPLQMLKIAYANQTKGKSYNEEEDRYLLVELSKYGVGIENTYEKIKRDIAEFPAFRFDWFFKSRTAVELGRRCSTLISLVDKEYEDEEKAGAALSSAAKKRGRVSTNGNGNGAAKGKRKVPVEGEDSNKKPKKK